MRNDGHEIPAAKVKTASLKESVLALDRNKVAVIIASQDSEALPNPEILLKPEDFILTDLREANLDDFEAITSQLMKDEVPRCLVLVGAKTEHQQLMAKFAIPVISLAQLIA